MKNKLKGLGLLLISPVLAVLIGLASTFLSLSSLIQKAILLMTGYPTYEVHGGGGEYNLDKLKAALQAAKDINDKNKKVH